MDVPALMTSSKQCSGLTTQWLQRALVSMESPFPTPLFRRLQANPLHSLGMVSTRSIVQLTCSLWPRESLVLWELRGIDLFVCAIDMIDLHKQTFASISSQCTSKTSMTTSVTCTVCIYPKIDHFYYCRCNRYDYRNYTREVFSHSYVC
jgi:hypothetical protein